MDATVSAAALHMLSHRNDKILFDPEPAVQLVGCHPLTQHLQHAAAVAVICPHALCQDGQALGRFWGRLCQGSWSSLDSLRLRRLNQFTWRTETLNLNHICQKYKQHLNKEGTNG